MSGQQLWTNGVTDGEINIVQRRPFDLLAEIDNNTIAEKRWGEDGVTQLRIPIMRSVD